MADAQFLFETNIRQVVQQIRQGLEEISQAVGAERGDQAGGLVAGLVPGVTKDFQRALSEIRRFKREADELVSGGGGVGAGQQAFTGRAEEALRGAERDLLRRVTRGATAARSAGQEVSEADIVAAYRALYAPLAQLRNQTRAAARQGNKISEEAARIYGAPEQISFKPKRLAAIEPALTRATSASAPPQATSALDAQISESKGRQAKAAQVSADADEASARAGKRLASSEEQLAEENEQRRAKARELNTLIERELARMRQQGEQGLPQAGRISGGLYQRTGGEVEYYRPHPGSGGVEQVTETGDPYKFGQLEAARKKVEAGLQEAAAADQVAAAEREYARSLTARRQRYDQRSSPEALERGPQGAVQHVTPTTLASIQPSGYVEYAKLLQGRATPLAPGTPEHQAAQEGFEANQARAEQAKQIRQETAAEAERAAQMLRAEELAVEANKELADALHRYGIDVREQARLGRGAQADVRSLGGGRYAVGEPSGETSYLGINKKTGSVTQLEPGTEAHRLAADTDARLTARAEEIASTKQATASRQAGIQQQRQERQATAALERAEKEAAAQVKEYSRRGLAQNFLAGATNPGFGGSGGFSGQFDGLARSAGQAVKYSVLYQTLGLLQQAASGAAKEFLDFNDSITELQIAMADTSQPASDFLVSLQDAAAKGGFNVGEAMDVAASGIRAFGETTDGSKQQLDALGESFATQSARIAVLTKGTLKDASNSLKAITNGFELAPNATGFTQITDAIAGAKRAGGGDETEIAKGLAGSALALSQMGFSVRESATLISKINADTAESGQTIATRISRMGSIIGGTSGKEFLRQLNQQLQAGQRIDLTAPIADQIKELGGVWNQLSPQLQQTAANRLGGQAQAREFASVMRDIAGVTKDAANNDLFVGAGAKEFEQRLTNVRAQLTYIIGDVRAIITNLAASGLAVPFVELITVIKPIVHTLTEITQLLFRLGQIGGGAVGAILGNVLALTAAFKVFTSIRAAGGLGALLQGQEARFLPAQARARSQNTAEAAAAKGGAVPVVAATGPVVAGASRAGLGVDGVSASETDASVVAARQRALVATRTFSGTSEDAAVHDAGRRVKAASERLAQSIVTLENEATEVNRELMVKMRVEVNTALASLDQAEVLQGRAGGIRTRYATQSSGIEKDLQRQLRPVERDLTRFGPQGTNDEVRYKAALKRREAIEEEFALKLLAVEQERMAAEAAFAQTVGRGRIANGLDAATGGRLGALRTLRQDEGNLAAARSVVRGTLRAGAGAARGLFDTAGGALGVGLIVTGVASAVAGKLTDISKAQRDADATLLAPIEAGASGLQKAGEANITAAQALRDASSGLTGSFANWLDGHWPGAQHDTSRQQADRQQHVGEVEQQQAKDLKKAQDQAGRTGDLYGSIDFTDKNSISQSLANLGEAGYTAAERMEALRQSIAATGDAAAGSSKGLSSTQRLSLAQGAGRQASQTVQDEIDIARQQVANAPSGVSARGRRSNDAAAAAKKALQDRVDFLKGLDQDKIGKDTQEVTQKWLDAGNNFDSKSSREVFKQRLLKKFQEDGVTPGHANALVGQILDNVASQITAKAGASFKNVIAALTDPANLQDRVTEALAQAPELGSQAAAKEQYQAARTGGVDQSASVGAKTIVDGLSADQDALRRKGSQLVASGAMTQEEVDRQLGRFQEQIDAANVSYWNALKSEAAALNTRIERRRKFAIGNLPPTGNLTKDLGKADQLNSQYGGQEVQPLIEARDTEGISAWIEQTSKKDVDAKRKQLHNLQIKRLNEWEALKKAGDEAGAATAWAALQSINGQVDAFEGAYGSTVAGSNGLNANQLKTQTAATNAAHNRDSLGAKKAALDAAAENAVMTRGEGDRQKALEEYWARKHEYDDAVQAAADAAADISGFSDSAIVSARKQIRAGTEAIKKFTKGTEEYNQGLAEIARGNIELAHAYADQTEMLNELAGDMTDPLYVAQQKLADLRTKLATDTAYAKAHPNDANAQNAVITDKYGIQQEAISKETTRHQQVESQAEALYNAGRTSHATYLRSLTSEESYLKARLRGLKKGDQQFQQYNDELLDVQGKLKSALSSTAGQFNLGDIKVPTVYQVRRSLQNSAAATSTVNSAVIANTTNNHITFNGADLAKIEAVVRQMVGQSNRYTTAGRKA